MTTTPAAAAIFFGWKIYTAALALTGSERWAIAAGLATAIALETVGILAGHVASEFWRKGDRRWIVAALVMALYVVVGMWELWGTTGALVFVLSPAVYLLAAVRHTAALEAVEDAAHAAEDTAWQRERERIADARAHELDVLRLQSERELAIEQQRIAAENEVELIRARAEQTRAKAEQRQQQRQLLELQREQEEAGRIATESRIECEDCGREFATVKALNAHGQWCKARVLVESNGHTNGAH
jgi:hypothetical protein